MIGRERQRLAEGIGRLGFRVYSSEANFLFFKDMGPGPDQWLCRALLEKGILIRGCGNYPGLDGSYYRVCVRCGGGESGAFAENGSCGAGEESRKMAKSIMIQGTMSNAGKSLLAAGLCRIFHQDGYRTAPFKSQNMALNSFITEEGLEIGRAQAVQAEAAGVKPSADMNPILLKPTTEVGSQVIVGGIHRGNMKASEYFAYKKQLVPHILSAYRRLEDAYDVIVIEGAGSPAEINLKEGGHCEYGAGRHGGRPGSPGRRY